MTARSFVLPVSVMVAAALLSGCAPTGGDPGDSPSSTASSSSESTAESTPSSDGEYVEASADGPAQNVPKPEKPALADEDSYEGAQAFLDYLADARAYAWQTGDTSLIREITDEVCDNCYEEYGEIDALYERGGWASAGRDELTILDKDMPVNSYGFPSPRVSNGYEGLTIWGPSGEVEEKYPPIASEDSVVYVHMEHMGDSWIYVLSTDEPA